VIHGQFPCGFGSVSVCEMLIDHLSGNPTNPALTASSLGLSKETAASALSGSSIDPLPLQLPLTIAMDLGPGT
jgi:hypothetical protein